MSHKNVNFLSFRDGRFKLGDELVNINGSSLRGLTMEEARVLLCSCFGEVVIILARDAANDKDVTNTVDTAPVERRRRRKLPNIERPRSAPIYDEDWSDGYNRVFQDRQTEYRVSQKIGLRTVIHISSNNNEPAPAQSVPTTPRIPHYVNQAELDSIKGKDSASIMMFLNHIFSSREKNE